eukprot:4571226-Pleurochrysis_carterae.AAC.1
MTVHIYKLLCDQQTVKAQLGFGADRDISSRVGKGGAFLVSADEMNSEVKTVSAEAYSQMLQVTQCVLAYLSPSTRCMYCAQFIRIELLAVSPRHTAAHTRTLLAQSPPATGAARHTLQASDSVTSLDVLSSIFTKWAVATELNSVTTLVKARNAAK